MISIEKSEEDTGRAIAAAVDWICREIHDVIGRWVLVLDTHNPSLSVVFTLYSSTVKYLSVGATAATAVFCCFCCCTRNCGVDNK